ncbi:MAG: rhomboid family intramembrane serine protease, partial [Gammaproteobacteria bacterium]|nr:rhomboid family intramembrane serine protease [Gammaproteobacteria bacterium]
MLAIPYSAALRLNKIPYVTLVVTLLCMLVFYLQLTNQHAVGQSIGGYCASIYKPDPAQQSLDVLRQDTTDCHNLLWHLHQRASHRAFDYIEQELRTGADNDIDPRDAPEIIRLLKEHLEVFQQRAPSDLDGKLMHFPDEWWNPIAMLTSSLAHSGWSHIVFNLIFFLAFAPAVEVLVNNTLKFSAVMLGIVLITGISYSLTVLISGQLPVPTLGLSGVVTGMIGLSAFLMPRARIRVFVWFIVFIRNYYIPAWILACWYIGWDTWDMLTTDEQGGVN